MTRKIIVFLLMITGVSSSWGVSLLESNFGTRAVALGGAYTAVGGDPEAIFWNPGGLPENKTAMLSLGYRSYIEGLNYIEAFGTGRLPPNWIKGTFLEPVLKGSYLGLGFVYWSTTEEGWDEFNEPSGEISASEYMVGLGYKRSVLGLLSVGGALKIAGRNIAGSSDFAMTVDVGAISVVEGVGIGFVIKNIGVGSAEANIPIGMVLGASYTVFRTSDGQHSIMVCGDMSSVAGMGFNFRVGGEYSFRNLAFVRLGYDFRPSKDLSVLSGLSVGIGASYYGFKLDFSFTTLGSLGNGLEVNLTYNFDNVIKLAEEDKVPPILDIVYPYDFMTPDGDGKHDTIKFSLEMRDDNGILAYGWTILDFESNEILTFAVTNSSISAMMKRSFEWDGKDENGEIVEDGKYTIDFWVADIGGNVVRESAVIRVSTDPYEVILDIPMKRIDRSKVKEIEINYAKIPKKKIRDWTIEVLNEAGLPVWSYKSKEKELKPVKWNFKDSKGIDLPSGKYKIRIKVNYRAERTFKSQPIEVEIK